MLLAAVAEASAEVARTSARGAKVERLAALLRTLSPGEASIAVAWLSGVLPQRQIGVGWAALRATPPPVSEAGLTIREVDAEFSAIGLATGPGSQAERRDRLAKVLAAARSDELLRELAVLDGHHVSPERKSFLDRVKEFFTAASGPREAGPESKRA